MRVLIFELKGPIAHFRRPDTMGTQATYPFITRTALRGLIASVLGLEMLPAKARCGIRLLAPVRTVAQELSLHGKSWIGGGDARSYHRPTAIELVVKPHYRVYYAGPHADELEALLRDGRSHYHTYLGSAFCLTFPVWVGSAESRGPLQVAADSALHCVTVVPSPAVGRLLPDEHREYARVGGILFEYLGERRFRGTVSVLYEVSGGPIEFVPSDRTQDAFWEFHELPGEGVVCLW